MLFLLGFQGIIPAFQANRATMWEPVGAEIKKNIAMIMSRPVTAVFGDRNIAPKNTENTEVVPQSDPACNFEYGSWKRNIPIRPAIPNMHDKAKKKYCKDFFNNHYSPPSPVMRSFKNLAIAKNPKNPKMS